MVICILLWVLTWISNICQLHARKGELAKKKCLDYNLNLSIYWKFSKDFVMTVSGTGFPLVFKKGIPLVWIVEKNKDFRVSVKHVFT